VFTDRADDNQPFYGIGIQTMLDGAQVRLEYNKVELDFVGITLTQLSVAWLL